MNDELKTLIKNIKERQLKIIKNIINDRKEFEELSKEEKQKVYDKFNEFSKSIQSTAIPITLKTLFQHTHKVKDKKVTQE